MADMKIRKISLLLLLVCCYSCYSGDSGKRIRPVDDDQFAPSELEREFPVSGRDSLYEHLTVVSHGRYVNQTASRLPGPFARNARHSGDEEEFGPPRKQHELHHRSAAARTARKQQRYLPYSPSYKSDAFLPDEESHWGEDSEKLIYRQPRDTQGRRRMRIQASPSDSPPSSSSDYPALFAYDINLAINSGVTPVQQQTPVNQPQSQGPDAGSGTPPTSLDVAFDIAPPPPPPPIDFRRLQHAMGPAMQGAQQDWAQNVANQRPDQCLVTPDSRKDPSLIWTVGKPSQNTRFAYQSEFASRRLADQFTGGNADHLFAYLDQDNVDQSQMTSDDSDCYDASDVDCDPDSPFRTYDGTCNNLQNPLQGSANSPQSRLGPAEYEDGISQPRRLSVASRIQNQPLPLPSAREVSVAISQNLDRESKKITYMFNQFGQFVAHDLTNTPVEKIQDPQNPQKTITPTCCGTDPSCQHPACFPISIPPTDPVYAQFGQNCMEFVRSQPAPRSGCQLGARIQLNSVTSYLDGSQIYGSKASDALRLRARRRGLLRVSDSIIAQQQNLVMVPGGADAQGCKAPSPDMPCVDAGDLRANQHTGLVAIHSLFLRLHNQIADFIATKRPRNSDETIYQLSRKIVGGILQHIYYKEMIPVMLGTDIAGDARNGLALTKRGYCRDCYDGSLDASMQVEFAAGAYRFHTLQDNTLPVTDQNGVEYPFYQHFGNPAMWYKVGIIDELLRNLPSKPAEAFDPQFTFIFQNQVFKPVTKPLGIDMLAFNNQRGRDHGVPTYTRMRDVCGLSPVKSFRDLAKLMPQEAVDNLASIYRHVRDIDFYAGGLSERPVNRQGLVGPTFACVLADQFQKIKNGDRFWYENDGVFTPDQLKEIRKVSMAAVLCQNSQTDQVQPKPFLIPSDDTNPIMSCDDILARGSMRLEPFLAGLRR